MVQVEGDFNHAGQRSTVCGLDQEVSLGGGVAHAHLNLVQRFADLLVRARQQQFVRGVRIVIVFQFNARGVQADTGHAADLHGQRLAGLVIVQRKAAQWCAACQAGT